MCVLDTLVGRSVVVAVVVPGRRAIRCLRGAAREALRWRARRPLIRLARRLGVPVWSYHPDGTERLEAGLRQCEPDLICVASFPRLLPASLLRVPKLGAIGVHPSLLPRHRGPEPLFWTYFLDDREAGVTLHWLDAGEDTGDLIYQEAIPLARGRCVTEIYDEISGRGSALLLRAVADVEAGVAPRIPQDQSRATREPLPRPGSWRIDFSSWGAERVWHFLNGLGGRHGRLLTDPQGRIVPHGRALGFSHSRHGREPGTLERHGRGWRVACRDGFVDVAGPGLFRRLHAAARRVIG